jgi:hypothetical protein
MYSISIKQNKLCKNLRRILMKKLLITLGVCLALFAFAACGDDEDTDSYISLSFIEGAATFTVVYDKGIQGLSDTAFAAIEGSSLEGFMLAMVAFKETLDVEDAEAFIDEDFEGIEANFILLALDSVGGKFGGPLKEVAVIMHRDGILYIGETKSGKIDEDVTAASVGKFVRGTLGEGFLTPVFNVATGTVILDGEDISITRGKFNIRLIDEPED